MSAPIPKVNFYHMQGCGYCEKANKLFANEIKSGEMKKFKHVEAPQGVTGFPTFENPITKVKTSGLPKDKASLYKKLGINGGSAAPRGNPRSAPTRALAPGLLDGAGPKGDHLVEFYSMTGCGHCKNAKETFKNEIASGEMKVLSHTLAPAGVGGFPTFKNPANGKLQTGMVRGGKKELYEKLGVRENFNAGDGKSAAFMAAGAAAGALGIASTRDNSSTVVTVLMVLSLMIILAIGLGCIYKNYSS